MDATRRARLQAVILEELSMVVPREVKDPRVPSVTFTSVIVTQDGSQATVYLTLLGGGKNLENTLLSDEAVEKLRQQKMAECLAGLASAAGFLRRHLAKVLNVRHVPTLLFREDKGLENVTRVHELLKKISSEPPKSDPEK